MKVIIFKTLEVKEVPLGYAVNYLLPKKLGTIATKKKLEAMKKEAEKTKNEKKQTEGENKQEAERLDGKVIEFSQKAGKAGKIHGSIGKKEIASKLKILKTQVVLAEPIKKLGEYEVELKFGQVKAKVKVKVA